MTAICLLLLVGAFAKSAQLPFHTWLPDAMEGPTPVSSLIHAATMVTAGVYLIARTHVLFVLAPTAADIAAFVGLARSWSPATIALVMTDLKRAIAYSTMSQIGYMIMGVSIGAYSAGMFHLMTHAFFKALLFMAAGSIIAAMANNQNIDDMKGFGKAMRFTSITMLCGGLALAAFPGTSGFFSKDEILAYATARGGMYEIFTVLGYFGALLTAIYTFRLIFRVLPGKPCAEAQELIDSAHVHHAHPSTRPRAKRRTPRSASQAPITTSPSSPGRCGWRWGCSPSWRCSPAWSRCRASTSRSPSSSTRSSPTRRWPGSCPRSAPPGRPGDRRDDLDRRHRHRLLALHRPPRDPGAADPAPAPAAHLPLQQVVLRQAR